MRNLAIIACVSTDWGIGKDGQLLWRFGPDMQFFRQTTRNHTVVMGRKTFDSIGKPLPQRRNLILSRQSDEIDGAMIIHSEPELRHYIEQHPEEKVFIIGGANLYQMFLPDAQEIYLTKVEAKQPADTFFPQFDKSKYDAETLQEHEIDGIKFKIIKYSRREA